MVFCSEAFETGFEVEVVLPMSLPLKFVPVLPNGSSFSFDLLLGLLATTFRFFYDSLFGINSPESFFDGLL